MKKNLAIFIYSLGKGGAEKIAATLSNYLKSNFNIFIVLLKDEVVYDIDKEISISTISQNPLAYKEFCKKNSIDISLSLLTRPNFISIFSKLLGNKTKIIVSEHTNTILWYSKVMQKMISLFYPKANKVICVSKKIEYNLNTMLNIKNTKVIYNPYEINSIINNREMVNEKIDFITMGTLYDVKNHELLIKSFSKINDKSKKLYILGDGPLRSYLEDLVETLNLKDKVFFLGFQKNPYKFLKAADTFILTSNNEGLPNVIIEALACNCKIISTDCISGPREILAPDTDFNKQITDTIEFTNNGVLVPIKNEKLLIEAMNLTSIESSNNVQRAHNFNIERQCEEYIKELNNI